MIRYLDLEEPILPLVRLGPMLPAGGRIGLFRWDIMLRPEEACMPC